MGFKRPLGPFEGQTRLRAKVSGSGKEKSGCSQLKTIFLHLFRFLEPVTLDRFGDRMHFQLGAGRTVSTYLCAGYAR